MYERYTQKYSDGDIIIDKADCNQYPHECFTIYVSSFSHFLEIPQRTFEIVVGVLGPFALLGVALTIGCVCCLCIIRYRRRNDGEHRPIVNHPPPHDDAGN